MENKLRTDIEKTIAYYNYNAERFVESTINADVSELYMPFEKLLSPGAKILDLGCGSGRDSKYFVQRGYDVVAVDPSPAMCDHTRSIVDIPFIQMKAEDLDFYNEFDAVWACASLLHVPKNDQKKVMWQIAKSLKEGGICYCSWKFGDEERFDGSRWFMDYTEVSLRELLKSIPVFKTVRIWITNDVRVDKNQSWINALIKKELHKYRSNYVYGE